MAVNPTAIQEGTHARVKAVETLVSGRLEPKQAIFTGSLTNAGTATVAALDAVGGAMRRVKFTVYYSGAVAGLGITPRLFMTSYAALTTFIEVVLPFVAADPSISSQHTFAATRTEVYPKEGYVDLPEGLQMELRVDSNGDDLGVNYEVTANYEQ